MTDPIVSITISDADIRDRLQRLQRKTGDLTPVMKNIGEQLVLSTDQRWEEEVSPAGVPWKPNSPYTIAQKKAQGRIQKILQSTGRLRSSINYRATRDSVTIGTNVSYAAKNQATRPFLGISAEDRQEIVFILEDFLAEP